MGKPEDGNGQKKDSGTVRWKPTIEAFMFLMKQKGLTERMRYNVIRERPEVLDKGTGIWRPWEDKDDSALRRYFQLKFELNHVRNLDDAIRLVLSNNRVNPLTDLLDSLRWDGTPRMEHFLVDVVKCDDTPYNREVSRLIFAEGVARAYSPGCKCDDMPVLVGPQGCGKSTLVRWLNMDDAFFKEIKTISGKEGIEALSGIWIGEVAELMAMTRVKESEAVKAFITSQEDSYRAPYDKHTKTLPRRCIFIGTTNNPQFLNDKTGNRRFYPVHCHSTGHELFERKDEIREEIRQCWAEAVFLYKNGKLMTYADPSLQDEIRREQDNAMEDDWRSGMIREFMDRKNVGQKTSVIEVWYEALNMDEKTRPDRKDSIEITQIMTAVPGWKRESSPSRGPYGVQRRFIKVENVLLEKPPDCPF